VWTIERIAEGVGGRVHLPDLACEVRGFAIDSRTLQPGELFIALAGERTDGHLFLDEAFCRGASGALVHKLPREWGEGFRNLIEVPDTLEALQRLASNRRGEFAGPIVGITGSSGKTTTKELLYAILTAFAAGDSAAHSQKYRAYRSPGNYNTEIGLPLALLEMPPQTEAGIFELALQRPGDIKELTAIARPTIGVLTTIGEAHLGFFPDREALAREKWELIAALPPEGTAIVNLDAPYLAEWSKQITQRVVGFALKSGRAEVRAENICDESLGGISFEICASIGRFEVRTQLLGRANVSNVLAAAACALELGVEPEAIQKALEDFKPFPHRLELKRSRRFGLILDDSYNASPSSTKESLKTLARLKAPYRKVFVFGDMLELGDFSPALHREIAEVILELGIERVFTLGELTRETAEALREAGWGPERVKSADDLEGLRKLIERELSDGLNLILVKGSRAMGLDRLVEMLL
jgi:UDP-N-acetylmuramoyl-tripeptide--D-alanyl-D-alanine ligase